MRRLRILTWHVHGNYLWYLTQVPHEFHLVTDEARTTHHSGRSGTLPWGGNVHEAPVDRIRDMSFDVVLYQRGADYAVSYLEARDAAATVQPTRACLNELLRARQAAPVG